mgnify:CR=1 FL=1
MKLSDIISPEYLEEQRRLHAMPEGYGQKGGLNWAKPFLGLMLSIEGSDAKRRTPPLTVLDFGAGGGSMKRELTHIAPWLEVAEFDPAVEGKTAKPSMASWVEAALRCPVMVPLNEVRGAVTVVDTRVPGRWRLVREGEDVSALAAGLRGGPGD